MAKRKHKTTTLQIRLSPKQKARYESAAYGCEKPVSEWVREVLDRAAELYNSGRGLMPQSDEDTTTESANDDPVTED